MTYTIQTASKVAEKLAMLSSEQRYGQALRILSDTDSSSVAFALFEAFEEENLHDIAGLFYEKAKDLKRLGE